MLGEYIPGDVISITNKLGESDVIFGMFNRDIKCNIKYQGTAHERKPSAGIFHYSKKKCFEFILLRAA